MSDIESAVSSPVVQRLRWVSVLETISFIVLLAMMFTHNETGVSIVGAIHGFLFLAYALFVVLDRERFGWSWGFAALVIVTGPVGAIIVLEKLRRQ